jgi:hypothetical protein
MELFLFWFALAVVVGIAASSRGRSGFGWFLLAVVISPLIAGILVLVLASRAAQTPRPVTIVQTPPAASSATKRCPECAEIVQAEARICRFCRHEFYPAPSPTHHAAKPDPDFKLPPV